MLPEERIREAIEGFVARVRQDLDVHGQSLGVDLTTAVRDQRAVWQTELDRAISDEQAQRTADLDALKASLGRDHTAAFARLLGAIRHLDASMSLRGILEALAAGARTEGARTVLLLREGRTLKVWGAFGYPDGQGPSDVSVDADSLLVSTVDGVEPVDVPAADRAGAVPYRPAFLRPPVGRAGRLVPLAVGGNVVAVLYSEGADDRVVGQAGPVWVQPVEILVRHAALRLENVTSIRTVEALTNPA
jgi:hypothetical protein